MGMTHAFLLAELKKEVTLHVTQGGRSHAALQLRSHALALLKMGGGHADCSAHTGGHAARQEHAAKCHSWKAAHSLDQPYILGMPASRHASQRAG
eukprot:1159501-Pelagomonas_calceolata.AAC.10